jgi:hypothetical protein
VHCGVSEGGTVEGLEKVQKQAAVARSRCSPEEGLERLKVETTLPR